MTTWYRITYQGFGCSPMKVIRELGLERREVVWFLSTVKTKNFQLLMPVREDREGVAYCSLPVITKASVISYATNSNVN